MKCSICKNGEMHKGKTTVTLLRQNTTFIMKDVPALVEKARKTPGLCEMIFYQKDI